MTKPRHHCVPQPGAIAVDLQGAAAAVNLSPESYRKLEEAGHMPRPRKFPLIDRVAYDLEEIREYFRRLHRVGDPLPSVITPKHLNDDDPWGRMSA
jgi:hypothetical protein